MSLTGVIADFATGTYTVTRAGAQTVTDGMVSEAAASTFSITASIQPAKGRVLELGAPEARSVSAGLTCYSTTELRVGDGISYKSQNWRVTDVKHWEEWGEEHWVASLAKVEFNP
jgi:hypothetical protein